jgi:hypothetical protein
LAAHVLLGADEHGGLGSQQLLWVIDAVLPVMDAAPSFRWCVPAVHKPGLLPYSVSQF